MTLAVMRHRRGGWVVVDGEETVSRHTTEWCAERVARAYALRRAGPRLGPLAATGLPPVERRSPQPMRYEPGATLGGALILTALLWAMIAGVVVLVLGLLH